MNPARRIILAVALFAVAAMGAFPPWVTAPETHPSATTPAGYSFILNPPSAGPAGPLVWSSKHQRFERDGRPAAPVKDAFTTAFDKLNGLDQEAPAVRFVRIDYARLLVQWVIVAALAGVAVLVGVGRRIDAAQEPLAPKDWPRSGAPMVTASGAPLPPNIQAAIDAGADPGGVRVLREKHDQDREADPHA